MGYCDILSLDGGGICGLLSCKLLERLNRFYRGYLVKISFFAGTSTRGILALGLAAGLTPSEIAGIYRKMAASSFPNQYGIRCERQKNTVISAADWLR